MWNEINLAHLLCLPTKIQRAKSQLLVTQLLVNQHKFLWLGDWRLLNTEEEEEEDVDVVVIVTRRAMVVSLEYG